MELLARLYVDYIEPSLKIGVFLIIAYLIIQLLSLIRSGKGLGEILTVALTSLVKIITGTVKITGKATVFLVVMMQKSIKELVKAVSDFFNSKI
jgi:hypothetical protein